MTEPEAPETPLIKFKLHLLKWSIFTKGLVIILLLAGCATVVKSDHEDEGRFNEYLPQIDTSKLIKNIEKQMHASAKSLDFEKAAKLRNRIKKIREERARVMKLEGEERAKCEWERATQKPGEVQKVCVDYSGEPRVQGYELCPPGWHDKFVAGVYREKESRNKEKVRSGVCVNNTTTSRQCKAGKGCRRAIRYEQCLWDEKNVYMADMYGEAASWYPCEK